MLQYPFPHTSRDSGTHLEYLFSRHVVTLALLLFVLFIEGTDIAGFMRFGAHGVFVSITNPFFSVTASGGGGGHDVGNSSCKVRLGITSKEVVAFV